MQGERNVKAPKQLEARRKNAPAPKKGKPGPGAGSVEKTTIKEEARTPKSKRKEKAPLRLAPAAPWYNNLIPWPFASETKKKAAPTTYTSSYPSRTSKFLGLFPYVPFLIALALITLVAHSSCFVAMIVLSEGRSLEERVGDLALEGVAAAVMVAVVWAAVLGNAAIVLAALIAVLVISLALFVMHVVVTVEASKKSDGLRFAELALSMIFLQYVLHATIVIMVVKYYIYLRS